MKTACPACGAASSLDAIIGHEGARAAVMVALQCPAPLGNLLVQYLGLFRPAQRQLSFERVASLLGELLPQIQSGKIERSGRIWSAPQDYWQRAIEDMLSKRDKLTLPLKGHGYLLAVIEGYSNKAEAKVEQREEDRKAGRTPTGGVAHTATIKPAAAPASTKSTQSAMGSSPCGVVRGKPRSIMPPEVKATLKKMQAPRKGEAVGFPMSPTSPSRSNQTGENNDHE